MNENLRQYIENEIFPLYQKNEQGHQLKHIQYVIQRSLLFADQFENINKNMVYTIAAFHDLAHHIDRKKHEILSAEMFYNNVKMKEFFTPFERLIIKEAIEDHRASSTLKPRSDYGKIISSADRTTSVETAIRRTYHYSKKHYSYLNDEENYQRIYHHLLTKYGEGGYAKSYLKDVEYEKFLQDLRRLLKNETNFKKYYQEIVTLIKIENNA